MRILFTFICVLALGLMGCSETAGMGGGGGSGGTGGTGVACEVPADCPGDLCTEPDQADCVGGRCTYEPVVCNDDLNDCTVEMCNPAVGCEQTLVAEGTTCAGGTCQAGVCELTDSVLPCSEQGIRNAIAAGGDEPYTFDCDGTTPVVIQAPIGVNNNVILDGGGNLTVTGSNGSGHSFFIVEEEVTAELRRFTMTGGAPLPFPSEKIGEFPFYFPGIINDGTLTVTDSTVSNKRGTGIDNGGTLTMTNSTVSGNRGNGLAGGIHNTGTLMLTNSTVSGNSGQAGGGILNVGTLTVTNSTISGNSADGGGGIFNAGGLDEEGVLTMTNSTVSGNTGGGIAPEGITTLSTTLVNDDCIEGGRGITSLGYNIESPGDTCGFDQPTDQVSVPDPMLGPLQNNGGPTMTHALLPGSVAIDHIPVVDCEVDEDQRGEPRPETGGTMCDVGSVEVQP